MRARARIFAVALLLASCVAGAARTGSETKRDRDASALRLTGEVVEVKLDEEEKDSINFIFKVRLKFTNEGGSPLILLSEEANEPWMGGVRLSRSRDEAAVGRTFLYDRSAWLSKSRTDEPDNEWVRLTKSLDKHSPPSGLTRVIPPGGSWDYEKEARLYIPKPPHPATGDAGWEEIRRASSLWLTLTFETWPANVEPEVGRDKAFGKKLRRRWKSYGTLWLDYIQSDPIEIRLPGAEKKGVGR